MRRRSSLLALGLVLVAAAAAYLPSIDGEFLLDDLALQGDPLVLHPLRQDVAAWFASGRPLAIFTFALNHAAVGLDPRGWHLTNVAIHLCVTILAFLFARLTLARAGLSGPERPALAAAALFALHPLQTEAVAYVAQRAESLASGLYLSALLLLLVRDAESGRRRHALLAGAAVLQAAALLTKPIAATLPVAWLLHAALLPTPPEAAAPAWRRVWRRVPAALPLLALSALAAAQGLHGARDSLDAGYSIPGLPVADYLATQLRVIPEYLRLLVLPMGQCADWHFPPSRSFLEPSVVGGALLLGAIVTGAVVAGLRGLGGTGDGAAVARAAAFGALFFLLVLAPSSSVVPLLDPLAEHRVYLASLGPFLAAAAGAALAARRFAGRSAVAVGGGIAAVALAALTALTAQRSSVWTTPLVLWEDAVGKAPGKARVHLNLGYALYNAGRPAEALASFRRSMQLAGDRTIAPDLLVANIVNTLLTLGRVDEARAEVAKVLAVIPEDSAMLALLAQVEYASKRDDEVLRAGLAAVAKDPGRVGAWKYVGLARARLGDRQGALAAFRAAAATNTLDPVIYAELGRTEEQSGNRAEACAAYARASALAGNPWASGNARQALARLGCR